MIFRQTLGGRKKTRFYVDTRKLCKHFSVVLFEASFLPWKICVAGKVEHAGITCSCVREREGALICATRFRRHVAQSNTES